MTQHPDLFADLAAPFDPKEVKARSQSSRQLHYITARTAMNRLDNVLGPENWWDEYHPSEHSVLCKLTIRLPDGSTLTKCDAGGYAGMTDQGDDDKSGYSDAFKRAAVKFGVARYLYRDGVPAFVRARVGPTAAAAVDPEPAAPAEPAPAARPTPAREPDDGRVPATGRALYAWAKEQETRHEVGVYRYIIGWAKLQEFPPRLLDWDKDQVALAYAEARRKLVATLRQIAPTEEAIGN